MNQKGNTFGNVKGVADINFKVVERYCNRFGNSGVVVKIDFKGGPSRNIFKSAYIGR
ncbi:MAG: hypothetical protein ACYTEQ_30190 [Planctomycetota bacterium]